MHGLALIYILRDLAQVRAFKVVQESLAHTRVLPVCAPALTPATRRDIEARFKARLGEAVEITIDEVADIAAEPLGKYRHVVSKVAAVRGGNGHDRLRHVARDQARHQNAALFRQLEAPQGLYVELD